MTAALHPSAYDTALAYLYGRLNYERPRDGMRRRWALNLERMRRLLSLLGNPQDAFPIVHVAGTKGKGSTATMIAAALTAAGTNTGLYTSPHLEQLEQRMQVDGACCTSDELVALVGAIRPVVERMDAQSAGDSLAQPTFFEITTAMSLLHFRDHGVGAAVLEVGLGGRLDSTNVCLPRVAVITSISFDHTEQLGNTLALIAAEKAGIIKPGVPVVTGVTQPEPLEVIETIARDRGAPLRRLDHEFCYAYSPPHAPADADNAEMTNALLAGIDFHSNEDNVHATTTHRSPLTIHQYRIGMWGRHQAANAAVAVETLLELRRQGWEIPDAAIHSGLCTARCPARVEVMLERPTVIVDVAHNVASVAALIDALDERFPRGADGENATVSRATRSGAPRMLIFAASSDKDLSGMLRQLLPQFDRVLLTRYCNNPRSASPERLRQLVEGIQVEDSVDAAACVSTHADPREALEAALESASPEHLICAAGSLFLAAEIRPLLRELAPSGASTASSPAAAQLPQPFPHGDPQLVMAKPAT